MVDGDSLSIGDISSAVSMICDGASSHASQDYEENTRISMKPKDRHYEKEGKRWVRRRENCESWQIPWKIASDTFQLW